MTHHVGRSRRPSRATYACVGLALGFAAGLGVCLAGHVRSVRAGVPEDVALAFTSRWFTPVRVAGGELTLRATSHWVKAEPAQQREACEEAYRQWRCCRASYWFTRVFVQDGGGVVVVTLKGTPRGMHSEPEGIFG